jgi:hypothetical protein
MCLQSTRARRARCPPALGPLVHALLAFEYSNPWRWRVDTSVVFFLGLAYQKYSHPQAHPLPSIRNPHSSHAGDSLQVGSCRTARQLSLDCVPSMAMEPLEWQDHLASLVLANSDLLRCILGYLDLDPATAVLPGAAALVCKRWHGLVGALLEDQRRQLELRFRQRYAARTRARFALSPRQIADFDALLASKLLPAKNLRLPQVVMLLERGASCELMLDFTLGANLCE